MITPNTMRHKPNVRALTGPIFSLWFLTIVMPIRISGPMASKTVPIMVREFSDGVTFNPAPVELPSRTGE